MGGRVRLISGIWALARTIAIGEGSIADLGEATLYICLFMIFLIVAVVLMLIGANLDEADYWLDEHVVWFEMAFMIAFKAFMNAILVLCVVGVGPLSTMAGSAWSGVEGR